MNEESHVTAPPSAASIDRRNLLKLTGIGLTAIGGMSVAAASPGHAQGAGEWDKVFPKSDRVDHQKVTFKNRFDITVAADLYVPKNLDRSQRHAALVVGHPYGGVKEQTSGLYAQTMAERGFITIAHDASFTGESGGEPRLITPPEVWVEDFSGAVDYLGKQPFVDRERIGGIGVCGGGGFLLGAAEIDPRVKAIATSAMYDIGQGNRQGLARELDLPAFQQTLQGIADQRWSEVDGAERRLVGATAKTLPVDADPITTEFWDYYGTPRGHHPRATPGFDMVSRAPMAAFWSFDKLPWISPRPLLFVTGDNAHSRHFSEQAYEFATEPKELFVVPNAGHVDLYDKVDLIPWDKLQSFFEQHLS
ncbi:hypothetical protein C241_16713 [Bradyrhizobium lupini HPC(L)]|uniref:Xaa-Pro dipeptidyl-peptidase-like domain-containing protein n=1 Tax=Bradyrhizobium lupini HPC(L) TaxID=1229491 RepID=A0ABP2RR81_RHILU|nr:hypothetical protein C241_16713 [Bradyrhizobium lupini HPC(L)]